MSFLQHHKLKPSMLQCLAFVTVHLSHLYVSVGKTIPLTIWTFVGKMMPLLFNMLSRFVIAFLPGGKHLFISWLQSLSLNAQTEFAGFRGFQGLGGGPLWRGRSSVRRVPMLFSQEADKYWWCSWLLHPWIFVWILLMESLGGRLEVGSWVQPTHFFVLARLWGLEVTLLPCRVAPFPSGDP